MNKRCLFTQMATKVSRKLLASLCILVLSIVLISCGAVTRESVVVRKNNKVIVRIPDDGGIEEEYLKKELEKGAYISYKKLDDNKGYKVVMTEEQYEYLKEYQKKVVLLSLEYFPEACEGIERVEYNDNFTEISCYVEENISQGALITSSMTLYYVLDPYQVRIGEYQPVHISWLDSKTGEVIKETDYDFWEEHKDWI